MDSLIKKQGRRPCCGLRERRESGDTIMKTSLTVSLLAVALLGLLTIAPLALADSPLALADSPLALADESPQAAAQAGPTELIGPQTPWRVFLRIGPYLGRKDGGLVFGQNGQPVDFASPEFMKKWTAALSPAPVDGWFVADFDDSGWGRYQADELAEKTGGYGGGFEFAPRIPHADRFLLRTSFGISDPAAAQDVSLELAYRGGVIVYVNGKEVGRGQMPAGDLDAAAVAEDYPAEAYLAEDGTTFLPGLRPNAAPEAKWKDRYEQRLRRLTLRLPPESLVKGSNVLAVEIRRAPMGRTGPYGLGWDHCGFHSARLLSASGKGAVAWTAAVERPYVWNAWPMEAVTENRVEKRGIPYGTSARAYPVRGLETGNPFDPLRPVRIAVPRNGTCAGVAVASDRRGVKGLSAQVSPLAGPGGATLKPEAIEIRYAAQQPEAAFCDVLLPAPPADAKNVPVWLLASPPKDQPPGWYRGTLSLSANGQSFQVPLEVLVTAFAVPATRDNRSMVGMIHSPDTLAIHYGVKPWSDKHFALMEKTIAMMGQLGSDVVHVPVTLGTYRGVQTGMIRWVKEGDGYRRDYTALEKFLDLWTKHCGPPKALTIDMYSFRNDPEAFEARDGGGKGIIAGPREERAPLPTVTLLDPASGEMTELTAPRIGDPAGEPFWRPVLDEVREIVRRRGWPDGVIMIGEAQDGRPPLHFVKLLEQWAPYARWSVFSHFSGDGRDLVGGKKRTGEDNLQADGRWLALPGLQVGYGGMPHQPMSPAMTPLDESRKKMTALMGGSHRCAISQGGGPDNYRTIVWWTGNSVHHGMDYWSFPGKGSLKGGFGMLTADVPVSMTAPGPDGPLPTVRFQMYREAVQEAEAWLTIIGACATRQDDQAKASMALYNNAVDLFARGCGVENSAVPLAKLSLGWQATIARAYEVAGELTGATSDATWQKPPAGK